jgi:hypothetical protein
MMKNMRMQNRMLIAMTLFSGIPPVSDAFEPPNVAKRLSGDGGELRGTPSPVSGAALPLKDITGVWAEQGAL